MENGHGEALSGTSVFHCFPLETFLRFPRNGAGFNYAPDISVTESYFLPAWKCLGNAYGSETLHFGIDPEIPRAQAEVPCSVEPASGFLGFARW